jgi:hypothetical protein
MQQTHAKTAASRWSQLDGKRRSFITRCEQYADLTIAKLCTPEGYNQNSQELSRDFQSVGAQAVNHLANKIMLALFAPSRPFFRLDPTDKLLAQIIELGLTEEQLALSFSQAEKKAIKALDRMAMRPKLYEAVKNLIVLGNVLLELEDDNARVIGIKKYVTRRSASGKLIEAIVRDQVEFSELSEEVQAEARAQGLRANPDQEVSHYRWIRRLSSGDYEMTQHVDTIELSKTFNGKWSEQKLPFRFLTWDMGDDADYGTGLVEDYKGDFVGLSMLSVAQIQGAILSSEFRWLVNPAGFTNPIDFMNSANGSALPGVLNDIQLVQSGKSADLMVIKDVSAEYVNRIGRGFLLGSAVTRDAERVTAEEIRMQAQELETSLGGAYSRLAVDFQMPMAYWLMAMVDMAIEGSDVEPSIVTGMDALSRGGDLEEMKMFLADCAALASINPVVLARMKIDNIIIGFATARRLNPGTYVKSEAEVQQEQAQMQAQQQQQMAAEAGANAGAEIAVQREAQG